MNTVIAGIALFLSVVSYDGPPIQRRDVDCMARGIYHEARGEPIIG